MIMNSLATEQLAINVKKCRTYTRSSNVESRIRRKKYLFTGDFDTRDSPLTKGAKPTDVDTIFIEELMVEEIIQIY